MNAVIIEHNQKITDKYDKKQQYDYSVPALVKVHVGTCSYFIYHNNPGNCKVCTISNLQSTMGGSTEKALDRLEELFRSMNKLVFRATFTDARTVEAVAERFRMVYKVKVPIGYGGNNMQYHCEFVTGTKGYPGYNGYMERLDDLQGGVPKVILPRPAPVAVEAPGTVNVTREQLLRIRSYKTDVWANKFINKLINGEDPQ